MYLRISNVVNCIKLPKKHINIFSKFVRLSLFDSITVFVFNYCYSQKLYSWMCHCRKRWGSTQAFFLLTRNISENTKLFGLAEDMRNQWRGMNKFWYNIALSSGSVYVRNSKSIDNMDHNLISSLRQ